MISKKAKIVTIIATTVAATSVATIGVTVGGYYSSKNANPYKDYYRTPATDAIQSYLATFHSSVLHNAKLLVLPGFTLNPPLTEALKMRKFNNTGFLLIDDRYGGHSTSQVASIEYRVDQGSFITGISLAMYLNEYKEYFSNNDGKLTWATYGGLNFSSVTSFMAGFQKGIDFFNNQIVPKDPNLMKVEQISLGGSDGDNYAGGFGPADGNSLIDKFLLNKVDCIIPVAGPQTMSAASKIVIGNKPTIVVGVDSAVEEDATAKTYKLPKLDLPSSVKQPTQVIPFSSLKKIDVTSASMIDQINKQEGFPTAVPKGNIGGFGVHSLGDVNNDGVGVSKPGLEYFINGMKKLDPAITDYVSSLNKLKEFKEFNKYFSITPIQDAKPEDKPSTTFNDSFISSGTSFDYGLPVEASVYQAPPQQIPPELKSPEMDENDWKEKLSFNLKGFITPNQQSDSEKIKIILSTSGSILLDASFSQASYLGVYYFYRANGINIPPVGGK